MDDNDFETSPSLITMGNKSRDFIPNFMEGVDEKIVEDVKFVHCGYKVRFFYKHISGDLFTTVEDFRPAGGGSDRLGYYIRAIIVPISGRYIYVFPVWREILKKIKELGDKL